MVKTERLTSQKQFIFDYLASVKIHPSAEKIYNEVKKMMPRISMGTIYRNLQSMVEKGKVREIALPTKRYDANVMCHPHFVCKKCQAVYDIDIRMCSMLANMKVPEIGLIEEHKIYFSGTCLKCLKK